MAKAQGRGGINLKRQLFEDLKRYCKVKEVPISRFVEELVRIAMERGWDPAGTRQDNGLFTPGNQPTGYVSF